MAINNAEVYVPSSISEDGYLDMSEARREYTRMRDIAQKRLKRLIQKNPDGEFTRYWANQGFRKISDMVTANGEVSASQLSRAIYAVNKFLNSSRSTLKGQREIREKALQTLKEHGYNEVSASNFEDFGRFMEQARAEMGKNYQPSDRVAELYEILVKEKLDPTIVYGEFTKWVENRKLIPQVREGVGLSSEDLKEWIELL